MSFKRWLLLGLLAFVSGAFAQTNNFNTLDRGGIQVLCKSAVAVSAPADTSEDTLATCAVPAGAMGANGALRISTAWSMTSSGNNKTTRIRFSGAAGTQYLNFVFTTSTSYLDQRMLANRGATNSQVGYSATTAGGAFSAGSGSSLTTSAVDTTAATSIVITCQKATAGETCTLESFLVELMPSN